MTINKYFNTWPVMTEPGFNCSQQHNANLWCAESLAIPKKE